MHRICFIEAFTREGQVSGIAKPQVDPPWLDQPVIAHSTSQVIS
jgi:hypothetical protein